LFTEIVFLTIQREQSYEKGYEIYLHLTEISPV